MNELFNGKHWLKGNLHMHTTESDGAKTPEEAAGIYRRAGYDFIALTDHYHFAMGGESGGLLRLSGAEYDSFSPDGYEVFHIVCAGAQRDPGVLRSDSVQETVNKINAAGGIAILAHPQWSLQTVGSIMPLKGLTGLEIYNSVSGLPMNCRPDSSYFSDLLSTRGKFLGCMAADDAHPYTFEACRSWIMVNTEDKSREGILNAIKAGKYYATQGPEFLSVSVEKGTIFAKTSEVSTVVFYTNLPWCPKRSLTGGITEFSYEMSQAETFVRIQVIDENGCSAWLNPITL